MTQPEQSDDGQLHTDEALPGNRLAKRDNFRHRRFLLATKLDLGALSFISLKRTA
jgi:hypothetical protein